MLARAAEQFGLDPGLVPITGLAIVTRIGVSNGRPQNSASRNVDARNMPRF